jgi:hypothetical protein
VAIASPSPIRHGSAIAQSRISAEGRTSSDITRLDIQIRRHRRVGAASDMCLHDYGNDRGMHLVSTPAATNGDTEDVVLEDLARRGCRSEGG